ncbi:unnamed protein product [Adineta steineri]|uniref:Uncharacterized protein n=1 Tax=Adineta steineri TaxID=433720 RepID=A0A813TW20_9BILA|nr:unnamed protein product [Adineta steineri]
MSKISNIRSIQSIYPGRLLLIDYGLSEKIIQGICHGLDQLFSIITTYVGIQRVPMFGLIVNGQNQSEIFLPYSSICNNHMELQVALCKLQLLAQKWSMKSNRTTVTSLSWHSALQLAFTEINSIMSNNNENRIESDSIHQDFQIIIFTSRLSDAIISDIDHYTQNQQIDKKVNKYSIGLYFKSWLLNTDHEHEHIQLYIPTNERAEYIDQSWHMIRCDLQEILIDPHHHINHDRFFIYTEPSAKPTLTQNPLSLSLPIYQLKALNFVKQANYCISMIFGMPLLMTSSSCHKYDIESIEKNEVAFDTLADYLRQNELMLICRLNDSSSMNNIFSGHFVLSCASERSLLLRSIASSEFLLPQPMLPYQIIKHEQKHMDENLIKSLSNMNIDNEEYNPLYYEARKSKITLNTNLI